MRRTASVAMSVFALTLIASVALASTISIADSFPQQDFDGNTGSEEWEDDWNELPESEQEGATEGSVQVVKTDCPGGSYCLAIMREGPTLQDTGASRHGDLSVFGNATLSFKMFVDLPGVLNLTDAVLWVKASGSPTPLGSYILTLHKGASQKSIPLSTGLLKEDFELSFVVTGLLDGDVLIDDVVISGSPVPPPTSTSSTTSSSTSTTLPGTTTSLPVTTLPTITTTTLSGLLTTSTSTTTTTKGSTDTTEDGSTTPSTTPRTSSGDQSGGSSGDGTAVTTSSSSGDPTVPGQPGVPESTELSVGPGLREASVGLQASFEGDRFRNVDGARLEVMGISIEPNYSMAVEVIESSWVYLLALILLIATAIVSGLDRTRLKRAKHTDV